MILNGIEIEGLRGFRARNRLFFAKPNGKPGSGLTVIVGANNAGKSTVMDAIRIMGSPGSGVGFSPNVRNRDASGKVKITLWIDDEQFVTIRTVDQGGYETTVEKNGNQVNNQHIMTVGSRRSFPVIFGQDFRGRGEYEAAVNGRAQRSQVQNGFQARLMKANQDPATRKRLNAALSRILGYELQWTVEQRDGENFFIKVTRGRGEHDSEGLGDGVVSLLVVVDALYDCEPGHLVAIDEPELSLHPSIQRRLAEWMLELSAERQLVIATHSPYFVDPAVIRNGGAIVRVFLHDNSSLIGQAKPETLKELSKVFGNINNPHILGLNALEALFMDDNVLLLEGQEDVVLFEGIEKSLGIKLPASVFGWGVGGAGNMPAICRLFRDLSFSHVAGILDKNKAEDAKALQTEFESYYFDTIPTDDVRTKKPQDAKPAVEGLLDDNKRVREKYRDETGLVFTQMKRFFETGLTPIDDERNRQMQETRASANSQGAEKESGPNGIKLSPYLLLGQGFRQRIPGFGH